MPSFTSKILGKKGKKAQSGAESGSAKANGADEAAQAAGTAPGDDSTNVDDIDEMDDQGQSILMGIISQLRPGCDLSRITLPTFILERKSMLERITNQLQEPELVIEAEQTRDDPMKRFLLVVKWYMACWHIAPKAVKKPLNPILGEYFTCYWDLPNNDQAYYVSEQTSHHPPKSSYFYVIPGSNVRVDGVVIPKSRFLGNSTAAIMDGTTKLSFTDITDAKGNPEVYTLTQPNMYARGVLFGKLKFELGDHMYVKCSRTGISADIDFKTKGFISGTYNAIEGSIKDASGKTTHELSGKWNEVMYIKDLASGKKSVFWDCSKSSPLKPKVRPLNEQGEYESRRLWKKVTDALANRDHKVATEEKYKIEEEQREEAKAREEEGVEFHPKLFRPLNIQESVEDGNDKLEFVVYKDHLIEHDLEDHNVPEVREDVFELAPILPGQTFDKEFEIPAYKKVEQGEDDASTVMEDAEEPGEAAAPQQAAVQAPAPADA